MFTEFELKLKADALYLKIHRALSSNADKSRYQFLFDIIESGIDEIIKECTRDGINDSYDQQAIVYNMLKFLERNFSIDPSPIDQEFREDWAMFLCDETPEFIIIREATEVFDERALRIQLDGCDIKLISE